MRLLLATLAALALVCGSAAAAGRPLIGTPLPDPTVVHADGAWWMTGTSGDWAPALPLYRSSDLLSWHRVGAVLPRLPRWARGNVWAPALTVRDGVWTVYFSASPRGGGKPCIRAVQARRPLGPYTDRGFVVCDAQGAIDPAVAGGVLVWKRMGVGEGIYGAPLSADGTRLAGDPSLLIAPQEPWEGGVTEGPDLVAHGGSSYLFYAGGLCCGARCDYAEGVAVAPAPLGPYTRLDDLPLLRDGDGWRCPGHGTVVEREGRLWLVHHAYRASDALGVHRLPLLDPVAFDPLGRPSIGAADAPAPVGAPPPDRLRDGFSGAALAPGWEWPGLHPPGAAVRGGLLRVRGGSISRPWVPRDFTVTAAVRGGARLGLLLSRGEPLAVRATRAGAVELLRGAHVLARRRARPTGLRLVVRGGSAVEALARVGGRWTAVGPIVDTPGRGAVDRIALGPGTFDAVAVGPSA